MNTPLDQLLEQTKAILDKLISFDTTSHKSNLELIDYVEDYFKSHGLKTERFYNEEKTKASFYALLLPREQKLRKGGIGLSGHTDVVPVTGQNWSKEPFKLQEENNRLYGRGTTDMKGFLACAMACLPAFKAANLPFPLYFLFSYDEEVGCLGIRPMIKELADRRDKGKAICPDIIIVGEPTNMAPVIAHKAIYSFKTEVTGLEAHSSVRHKGVSAIAVAARLITWLEVAHKNFKKNDNDERFAPPHSTLHVGVLSGGTARNIVAKHAEFYWELRALPGFDGDQFLKQFNSFVKTEIEPAMKAISPDCGVETTPIGHVPALSTSESAIEFITHLTGINQMSAESYGTEAGLFEQRDMPTIVIGPGHVSEAHIPDEFIEIEQLKKSLSFLLKLRNANFS